MSSLRLSSISSTAALLVGQAATAGLVAVVARRVTNAEFGVFVVIYSLSLFFGGCLDLGSSQLATRELARESRTGIGSLQWLAARTAMQLVPALVFAALVAMTTNDIPAAAAFAVALQALAFSIAQGALAGVRVWRGAHVALWLVAIGNLAVLLWIIATPQTHTWLAVALGVPTSWMIAALGGVILSRDRQRHLLRRELRNPWAGSMSLGLHGITIQAFGLNVAVVGWLGGAEEAARLGAVSRWIQPLALLASASAQTSFPAFASAPDGPTAVRHLAKMAGGLWVGVLFGLGLMVGAPLAVKFVLGDAFASSTTLLRLLLLSALPVLACQPLASLLQARHDERFVARAAMVATAGGMSVVLATSHSLGAFSAPIGTGFMTLGLAIAYGARVRRLWSPTKGTE